MEIHRLLGPERAVVVGVAMRSGTVTKSGLPSLVTFSTKATIAFFGALSFHEGKGSVWAIAGAMGNMTAAWLHSQYGLISLKRHGGSPEEEAFIRLALEADGKIKGKKKELAQKYLG